MIATRRNMPAVEQTENTEKESDPPRRRPARRQNRNGLGGSLSMGSSVTSGSSKVSQRRAASTDFKASFSNTVDKRATFSLDGKRLSQSMIDQSGQGLDQSTIDDILNGFEDDLDAGSFEGGAGKEKEESDNVGEMKPMAKPKRGGRRSMLASIESQKSMHFNKDDCDSDSD